MDCSARLSASLLALSLTALTGCALISTAPAGKPDPVAFTGAVIGGENPIAGATVTFYETSPTGVATNGVYVPASPLTPLEATVTDANGNFSFATPTPCTSSSDYVYVTAVGGNTGAGINPNSLIMSTVGSCSSFGSSSYVVVNEISTVAAAYALQGFTSISGTYTTSTPTTVTDYSIAGGVATVNAPNTLTAGQTVILSGFTTSAFLNGTYIVLSASSTSFTVAISNADVADTTESGTATGVTIPVVSVTSSATNYATASASGTVSAAGLAHAFTNAANLKTPAVAPANTSIPGTTGTVVPAATINALANSIQACVNSTGGVASNTGTTCGKLFSYTTVNGTAPTNTLSALLNIARNPTGNVQNICTLTPTVAAFSPAVTCGTGSPNDWSIAILYPQLYGQTSGSKCNATYNAATSTNGLCYPLDTALDINDNVYVLNGTAATSTATNVVAISAAGAPLWSSALDTTDTAPGMIAADGIGNVFYVNNGSTASTENILQFATASGTPESSTTISFGWGIAIDSSNNLWVSRESTASSGNIQEFTRGTTGSAYTKVTLSTVPVGTAYYPFQIAIDPSLNLWLSDLDSVSTTTAEKPSLYASGHTAAEFYANTAIAGNYGIAIDSHGYGWATSSTAFYKIVPSPAGAAPTSAAVTLAGTYTPSGGTASLRYLSIDGNNTIWGADDNGTNSAIVAYPSAASSPAVFTLRPCVATGTACAAAGTLTYATHHTSVDSTGSLWITSDANGTLGQVIGAAAPTWPLLSLLKFGMP